MIGAAIERVLTAFRSTSHHVDEDDIQRAWLELGHMRDGWEKAKLDAIYGPPKPWPPESGT